MDEKKAPVTRYAHALFCDDVRHEVGNKATFVGVYNGDMFVSEFPVFIPKLGVCISVVSPIEDPAKNVKFVITREDTTILAIEIPESEVKRVERNRPNGADAISRQSLVVNFVLPPMTIMQACTLRASALIDGLEFTAGKLHVMSPKTDN